MDNTLDAAAVNEFSQFLAWRESQKAAGTTPSTTFAHGPGGIVAQPGQRAQVVNAMVMPRGFADILPAKKSKFSTEVFPILTGQTAGAGDLPSTACGDWPTPGNLKICNQTWPFGRRGIDSQVLQVDRLGLLQWRSEFVDQTIIGDPFSMTTPITGTEWNPQEALRNEKAKKIQEMFIEFKRRYAPLTFTGNPVNNSGTGYAEAYGLNSIINTGLRDAYTQTACPAADARVVSFGNAEIGASSTAFVNQIVELYSDRVYLSKQVGLDPVQWVFVMRYQAFRKATEVWPCTYATYRCLPGVDTTGNALAGLGMQMNQMRDEMRQGQYLLIEGVKVPVVIDDSLVETIPVAGTAQSDILLVPMSSPLFGHNPGGAITYIEYFDMNDPVQIMSSGVIQYPQNSFATMGGGRFLVYPKAPSNVCIQYGMLEKSRIICEAPFLGARLTNVRYVFTYHERNYDPAAAYYHYNGGSTTFPQQPYIYPQ